MKNCLWCVDVVENEFEKGWGCSQRSAGKAFCENKDNLVSYFEKKRIEDNSKNSKNYGLYYTISSPKIVQVKEKVYKSLSETENVNWLDIKTAEECLIK